MLECVEIHMHADIACMTSVQCCNVALFGWWTKICTFPGSTITTITIFNYCMHVHKKLKLHIKPSTKSVKYSATNSN